MADDNNNNDNGGNSNRSYASSSLSSSQRAQASLTPLQVQRDPEEKTEKSSDQPARGRVAGTSGENPGGLLGENPPFRFRSVDDDVDVVVVAVVVWGSWVYEEYARCGVAFADGDDGRDEDEDEFEDGECGEDADECGSVSAGGGSGGVSDEYAGP